ncbi:uncharacterized protein LOC114177504 isoform X2 [Vigna unguiculata]|uniref:uncharacterized protein LOC114177504 isoform X2 n=1 Tax=Vigna unguiculata TaxID=3917 RepID=UPI0010165888|nr:uncharacterized protein LOC114177504 isoform X2 [Vigna unguiculata]
MSLLQKGLCCVFHIRNHNVSSLNLSSAVVCTATNFHAPNPPSKTNLQSMTRGKARRILKPLPAALPVPPPLDLTEDNVRQALEDARQELGQIFDTSVGMTALGVAFGTSVPRSLPESPIISNRGFLRFWRLI